VSMSWWAGFLEGRLGKIGGGKIGGQVGVGAGLWKGVFNKKKKDDTTNTQKARLEGGVGGGLAKISKKKKG